MKLIHRLPLALSLSAACLWGLPGQRSARPLDTAEPRHRASTHIEDHHRPSDGSDFAPALRRALASFPQERGVPVAGRIVLGPRTYPMGSSVDIDRAVLIDGEGGPGWFGASVLEFAAGVDGLVVHHLETSGQQGSRGSWSILRNLVVRAAGASPSVTTHGITLLDRATIEHVYVTGFSGNGVRIVADVTATPPTNANLWRIFNVRVDGCGSHGVFVDGGDTNAGVAVALDSSSNGGYGIFDSSFIGNTYVGAHAAANGLGGYRADENSARCLFLNCYAETGNQPPSRIDAPSLVLGGTLLLSTDSTASRLSTEGFVARFDGSVEAENQEGPVTVRGTLGSTGDPNTALELWQSGEPSWPWRMSYDETDAWWKLQWANLNSAVALALSVDATPEGRGQLWLPNGFHLGAAGARIKQQAVQRDGRTGLELHADGAAHYQGWAESPPVSGTFARGDVVWNTGPGTEAGWRYDGTGWAAF